MSTGMMLVAVPASIISMTASAGDKDGDTAIRFYFALPFSGPRKTEPGRLGFQLLSEKNDGTLYSPIPTDSEKFTAIDLGFNRDGLAKFDMNGYDMRDTYEMFARAIGLTPDEVELCRESDCLDWVKSSEESIISTRRLGDR